MCLRECNTKHSSIFKVLGSFLRTLSDPGDSLCVSHIGRDNTERTLGLKKCFGLTDRRWVSDYPHKSVTVGMRPFRADRLHAKPSGPGHALMTVSVHNLRVPR